MKRGVLIGAGVAVVAAAIGFWFMFIRDDAPPELSLDDAVADITGTSEPNDGGSDTTPAPTTLAAPTTVGSAGLDGTWNVDQANSVVGYRVGEEISGIGTTEAVGRTSQVTGSLTLSGTVIETVAIDVDMTTLESDSGNRDDQLRTRGLETDTFPSASFVLSTPVDLGSIPADGEAVSILAAGELTLHGVTREVEIPLDGSVVNGTIVVVGQLDVLLADYDIDPPVGLRILTIEDQGVFEVQLAFTR